MLGRSILGMLVVLFASSCKASDTVVPPPCRLGDSCSSLSDSSSDAGPYDAGPGGDVTGMVQAVDATFQPMGAAVSEPLTILGPTPAGGVVSAMSMGTSFELAGLRLGDAWFLVEDAAPLDAGVSPAFLCTFSLSTVAATPASIALSLMPAEVMGSITRALDVTATNGSAQVAVLVTHDGAPSQGVAITMPPAGVTVAYDAAGASPTYATSASATGARGVALLLDVPASAEPENFSLMIGAAGATATTVEVPIQSGCITIERYAL